MQRHQIDLVPGESIRVGHLIVTLVSVKGSKVEVHVAGDGEDDSSFWTDPVSDMECEAFEPAYA